MKRADGWGCRATTRAEGPHPGLQGYRRRRYLQLDDLLALAVERSDGALAYLLLSDVGDGLLPLERLEALLVAVVMLRRLLPPRMRFGLALGELAGEGRELHGERLVLAEQLGARGVPHVARVLEHELRWEGKVRRIDG